MREHDQKALRAKAEALMCRTAQVAPELVPVVLWGLCRSSRYTKTIQAGEPDAGALAALLALIPEAREIFEASRAGQLKLGDADGTSPAMAGAVLSPELAALALRLPAESFPVIRRMICVEAVNRRTAAELAELWRELAPFMGDADEDDA